MIADAGCEEVLIGFESPTAAGLDGIELRRNWKRRRLDGYRAAIDLLQSNGIAVNACFVLGSTETVPRSSRRSIGSSRRRSRSTSS